MKSSKETGYQAPEGPILCINNCGFFGQSSDVKPKEGPTRCTTCRKHVGLTRFNCKCGNLLCAAHRYSDKHDYPYDCKNAGRDAIAKAVPAVVVEKPKKI
uniref:Zinc finger A20 and AN1 domain-containing stress-associated protein 8-like n=2 Tax=Nicotiana TaxID=4085 RepID=A0A1S4B2X7_TOBAC|nr:PREDICTED: zinc finger A20 and AN1 domain-containing stress-associated protein 8-like [Nicotiana sylvestris]XP_016483143.1 PREDICTED: zinc finger A20 and AN1 domain-containing stress-associated protein 8-like [Nicotiana tabacum]